MTVTGTPAFACTRNTFLAMSGSMSVREVYSFAVSTRWSATTAIVMPDSVARYDSAERSLSCQYSWGCSTRSCSFSVLRGSNPALRDALGVPP